GTALTSPPNRLPASGSNRERRRSGWKNKLGRHWKRKKFDAKHQKLAAARLRIVRQLLTESVLLAAAGGVFGILLGISALSIFKSVLPLATPGLAQAAINWRVVGTIAVLTFVTGLGFGVAPALSCSQIDLSGAIRTG